MKCINCKSVMELGLQHEDGSYSIEPGSSQQIEHEGGDVFIRCPHCNEKNILIATPSDHGPEKLYFRHHKLDQP